MNCARSMEFLQIRQGRDLVVANDLDGFQQILCDVIRFDRPAVEMLTGLTPGQHKNGAAPGIMPGDHVGLCIADKISIFGSSQSLFDRTHRLLDQPDVGLSAIAPVFGPVSAVKNFLNMTAVLFNFSEHFAGDTIEFIFAENTLSHPRLVGNNKNRITGFREHPDSVERTGQEFEFLDLLDVISVTGKLVDDSVSIQKDKFHS